MFDLTSPE